MTLGEFVSIFLAEQRTECQLLEPERVLAMGIAATKFYCGWGHNDLVTFKKAQDDAAQSAAPVSAPSQQDPTFATFYTNGAPAGGLINASLAQPIPPVGVASITDATPITESDWALIRPLFLLYCEREQALMLESSRVMGVDVFGRATSEVQSEITQYEADLPRKAFIQPAFTI